MDQFEKAAREICESFFAKPDLVEAVATTLRTVAAQARREALDQAAAIADQWTNTRSALGPLHGAGASDTAQRISADIRALKETRESGPQSPV